MQVALFKETTIESAVEKMNRFFTGIDVSIHQVTQLAVQEIDTKTIHLANNQQQVTVYICILVFYSGLYVAVN